MKTLYVLRHGEAAPESEIVTRTLDAMACGGSCERSGMPPDVASSQATAARLFIGGGSGKGERGFWTRILRLVEELLEAGIRIYEYQPAMIHQKTAVMDGRWSIVGSANMDVRSKELNQENALGIQDSGFARQLTETFFADLEYARTGMAGGGWPGTFDDVAAEDPGVAGIPAPGAPSGDDRVGGHGGER